MARGPELRPVDQARILELKSFGWVPKLILKKHSEWSFHAIRYTIRKEATRATSCKSLPRSGQSRHLTAEDRDYVYDAITHTNPHIQTPDRLLKSTSRLRNDRPSYFAESLADANGSNGNESRWPKDMPERGLLEHAVTSIFNLTTGSELSGWTSVR